MTHVDDCLALARKDRKELRAYAGFSITTGRTKRLALRMRRVGAILRANPELEERCRREPPVSLRALLLLVEAQGKGARYKY